MKIVEALIISRDGTLRKYYKTREELDAWVSEQKEQGRKLVVTYRYREVEE